MLKQALSLSASNGAVAVLNLLRNILIARLISVEDFGIASTFAITMSMIEMASGFALDRMLVQAPNGISRTFQNTVQLLQAVRGALAATVLFLVAGPIASVFGVPDIVWTYQLLALVPLIRGIAHFDMFRLQRQMQFATTVKVELGAMLVSSLAALPLAYILGDYRAMLFAVLLQQIAYTVSSHLFARRRYGWSADGVITRRAINFGWPLLLNGILMFIIFQGDRIIVGSMIGLKELGWFSAALTLTMVPTIVIAKTLDTFFLPQLSRSQEKSSEFSITYLALSQAALVSGVMLAFFWTAFGSVLINLLYGSKYGPAVPLLVLLSITQGLRIGKAGPAIASTARADTKNPMIANFCRVLFIPLAWWFVSSGAGVVTVIFLAIAGEGLALAVSLFLLRYRQNIRLQPMVPCLAYSAIAYIGVWVASLNAQELTVTGWVTMVGLCAVWLVPLFWSAPELRRWGYQAFVQHRAGCSSPTVPAQGNEE